MPLQVSNLGRRRGEIYFNLLRTFPVEGLRDIRFSPRSSHDKLSQWWHHMRMGPVG
jgi:hypothetical protein